MSDEITSKRWKHRIDPQISVPQSDNNDVVIKSIIEHTKIVCALTKEAP
jgi:hypothetical protein